MITGVVGRIAFASAADRFENQEHDCDTQYDDHGDQNIAHDVILGIVGRIVGIGRIGIAARSRFQCGMLTVLDFVDRQIGVRGLGDIEVVIAAELGLGSESNVTVDIGLGSVVIQTVKFKSIRIGIH